MERNEPLEVLNGHNGLDSEGGNVGDTSQSKNHLSQINTNEINPDSPTHESDDHVDNSQLIREATAAAIDDAVKMKRSDSILSESDDGANDSLEDDITSSPPTPGVLQRRSTSAYIEAASVEASLSPIHHRRSLRSAIDLRFSGSSTGSSLDKSGKDLEINEVSGESERDVFHGMLSANFESLDLQLDTIVSCPSEETTHEVPSTQDLSEILESCGLQIPLQSSPFSDDVVLLHALFEDFCNPPLDIQNVENVLEMERGQDTAAIKLPMDVVIHMPSNVLVKLLGPTLLSLPKDFAMAMFRILLRLLTNDTDAEYDSGILVSCTWYDEMFAASPADPPELTRQRTSSSTGQSSFSEKAFNRNSEARKVDQMYTMVRLQRNWSDAVSQVLRLLKSIIHDKQHEYLQAPVTRLLGLLCTGSVAVSELRQILELSADSNNSPKTRLLLVRALRIAAAGASRASLLVGKASPRHFFSFVSGEGISRTISLEKSSWPFKNDFGMALWFRAEYFSDSSTVFRATDQSGNGTEISLLPVMKRAKGPPTATVLAISILEAGKAVHCIKVSKCVLHARVWYHVSVRHTRSRLKGVFSLASREQVSVILDGKNMVTESLAFPRIYESSLKTLHLTFGASFNGQTGGLYVFHENVSDATFKALYEMTAETNGVVSNRATAHGEWDSQRGDIVRKSRVLDLSMHRDDVEDIVLSDSKEHLSASAVVDIEEEDESFENGPLSKTSFNSKLYLVWDPRRTETNVALELHSGAHVRMNIENVQPWTVQGAQDVISSIGGVQALLPVFRSLLSGDIEKKWLSSAERNNQQLFENAILCSSVPDLLFLLASFVRDHNENAREMLRCGGIDIVEQFLHSNKNLGKGRSCSPASSLVAVLSTFPRLSTLLVDSMLELRSACSHYVGLETKVFSRLLFNLPLWFGRLGSYVSLYTTLFPVLSSITRNNPEKVRDCVGIKDMTQLAKELIELERNDTLSKVSLFQRETHNLSDLQTKLTLLERRHVVDVLLGMIFQVLGVGSCCADDLSQFLNMISYFLESEWDQSSREVAGGVKDVTRSGVREDKYIFTLKACTILLFLFQIRPTVPGFFESFAGACGSVPGGAAWILSAMVNSYCDRMRSIGVRCIVSYVERTAQNPEQPLSLGKTLMLESDKTKNLDNRSIQENTLSLISNVGQGFLNSNVGKGLAATVRSRLLSPSKLTAGVVYKLLWHLLKSHRYRMGHGTQASLTSMVFERNVASFTTFNELKTHFLAVDHLFRDSVTINMAWTKKVLEDTHIGNQVAIRDSFGISTLMRLLRFLPDKFTDQWLSILVRLSSETLSVVEALSLCPDWQPCLFQFISELMEKISGLKSKISGKVQRSEQSGQELMVSGESPSQNKTAGPKTSFEPSQSNLDVLIWRLDLALRLYAGLLGHRIREGGDKALSVIEDMASLQRVCLNGQEVVSLILSSLLANLAKYGVVSIDQSSHQVKPTTDEPSFLLKRSSGIVTDAILSNGTQGMNMAAAVGYWRSLRHLTATTVAISTRLGFGVAELFDYRNKISSAVDKISGGLHGIRLVGGKIDGITAEDLGIFYKESDSNYSPSIENGSAGMNQDHTVFRRVGVFLAAQLLSLLDVFIFPDSLDASLPGSQLHGLALVRSTEKRIGSAQGPLLTSLIRLSLLLLCHLEPCSVELLQCSSRLRCFLHWVLELIRESETLEGYTAAFNKLTAPFDRLILAIVLQCHRTLGRCGSLLSEIESTPYDTYFENKESQKKSYRRLLRVALELRDILLTTYERRKEVLRTSMSSDAYEALRSCLETPPSSSKEEVLQNKAHHSKEIAVRALLSSDWVTKYQDVDIKGGVSIPCMLCGLGAGEGNNSSQGGARAIEELSLEDNKIVDSFEQSLNVCFEKYLEAQRQWAETGAVRDLEFDGDMTLKRLSKKHSIDLNDFSKNLAARNSAMDVRWRGIYRKVTECWKDHMHWKLARYTDRLGRRILLVPNRQFDDHSMASYDLMMGKERGKGGREERLRHQRELLDEQLSEVMKRNTDAFVPFSKTIGVEEEEKEQDEGDFDKMALQNLSSAQSSDSGVHNAGEVSETGPVDDGAVSDEEPEVRNDVDAWAKTFIWSDSESVVARFESVVIVTLQYLVEGSLLLTTHGLYFHQTGDEINVVTREPIEKSDASNQSLLEVNDRRWRLSRLAEVHGRRYMLRAQALELFFSDSHELFLNFLKGDKERNRFNAKLRNSCKVPMLFSPKSLNPRSAFKKSKLTELWTKRKLSNFEYLMALNRIAGRTFNDIAQYPVFPWILSDYTSEKIDLADSRVYRDLSKPVGALNPDRLAQLLERYNELELFGFSENEKFLYGSHYSSPGVILHYLIRQEPFTSMAIDLQSGRFDCPDRLFFDIIESWKSCNTSSSDVKELIPEFFTLPELLLNNNKFPLGKTQRGCLVDDVNLPPWAKGSAYEFVRIHRLALESEYVSRNLHHWVDLIFGYKQRGPASEAAHNVFHHLSYEGSVDLDKITDELDRQAAESHIQNFGQTPSQLLVTEPHPARYSPDESWAPLINNMSSTVRLRCHTPAKQFGGKRGGCGSVTKVYVQADSITVIYSDLKVGTFKWNPKAASNRLKPDKLRSLPNREVSNSRAVMKRGSAAPQTMDDSGSRLSVGNWSFSITLGGYEKEQVRRKTLIPSRLASAKDALYTEAASLIVSCGYWDNTLKVHSTDAWRVECSEAGGHRGPIRCLAIGQDGGLLVTGGEDSTCRVWVVNHPDMAIALADGYVQTALGQSTDGDHVLSCCRVLWGHDTPVTCLDLSSDLDAVVSGSSGGKICVHTLRRGDFVRSIHPSKNPDVSVAKLAIDNHGRIVAHMGDGGLHTYTINGVRICSIDAGEKIHDMKITGEVLLTGGDRCHVYIRDLMTLKVLSGLDLSRHGPIRCISLTPDELNPITQHLFIGSDDGMISIVDRDEEK